ncbi:uncharacterized protein LOC122671851 isoform X2 [Telopea speciosissima]|uniref:uncharacterized protein LOC122671851 isoform X2 n=1 Tax=Telopea speciosissima TaxID=54955 RepID=UPI001CC60AFB|nr:uncharacterized protein LOC122671851 isoform X2 [Telopea speciosissima]
MAGAKRSSSSSPISIGNCKVDIYGNNFTCQSKPNNLQISVSDAANIKISVNNPRKRMIKKQFDDLQHEKYNERNVEGEEDSSLRDQLFFFLVHPKDIDSRSKSLLQEVLTIYMKELPAMNYAANTGKESLFLERCVFNGKYCTLLLKSNSTEGTGEVIAAITYQIIPTEGIGCLLYAELRKRLQNVGIRTILCWADKESEGFWLKQGFVTVAEVDISGRVRKLPIKADIRRALCFPGGSTLMVSHLNKDFSSVPVKVQELVGGENSLKEVARVNQIITQSESPEHVNSVKGGCSDDKDLNGSHPRHDLVESCADFVPLKGVNCKVTDIGSGVATSGDACIKNCSCSGQGARKRDWEASLSSLKSKKIKGSHHIDCQLESNWDPICEQDRGNRFSINGCSMVASRGKLLVEVNEDHPATGSTEISAQESGPFGPFHILPNEDPISKKLPSKVNCPRIMLMNMADDVKKERLTKIIEDLDGIVTSEGSVSTHIITGKVRRTLNLCVALCSGAWIISPSWLKESFREGRLVDELPFILKDEDYESRYKTELKDAVQRAKARPRALLKGYDICLAVHVQPPVDMLSAIAKSAGGNVLKGLDKVVEPSKTIFVACEEDMEEALVATNRGLWTFNGDWFMNCIMRQELDLEAPKFAESL